MHILIVGCGLGGLACAIAARHEGVEVTILEQGDGLNEVDVAYSNTRANLTNAGRRRHTDTSQCRASHVETWDYGSTGRRRASSETRK